MIYMDVTHIEEFIFERYYKSPMGYNVPVTPEILFDWLRENNISPVVVTDGIRIPAAFLGQDIDDSKFLKSSSRFLKINLLDATSKDIGSCTGNTYLGFDTMDELLLFKLTWL